VDIEHQLELIAATLDRIGQIQQRLTPALPNPRPDREKLRDTDQALQQARENLDAANRILDDLVRRNGGRKQ